MFLLLSFDRAIVRNRCKTKFVSLHQMPGVEFYGVRIRFCITLGTVHTKTLQEKLSKDCWRESMSQSSTAQLFLFNIDLTENLSCQLSLPTLCRVLPESHSAGVQHLQVLREEFKRLVLRKCMTPEGRAS